MISWGLRGTPYQNILNYWRGRTLKTALQPQLIIHIVSHSTYLVIILKSYYYENIRRKIERNN